MVGCLIKLDPLQYEKSGWFFLCRDYKFEEIEFKNQSGFKSKKMWIKTYLNRYLSDIKPIETEVDNKNLIGNSTERQEKKDEK